VSGEIGCGGVEDLLLNATQRLVQCLP
jgi:hypothetical protein